ncbi:MAG: hypothetical protein M0018_12345 [Nitrospiraceae bacterium]|nr:hypothetical protein [Nitrospiraceae bacterium]
MAGDYSNNNDLPVEIGGYFGLDMPDFGDAFADTIKFQSGRAAMRAVIERNGLSRVMVPSYVCDSIIKAARDAGAEVEIYGLDGSLYPEKMPLFLPERSALVYVNYFGLCGPNIARLLEELPPERLIIDNSHALFAEHSGALASVYSPRKFAGLPDGGLLRLSPGSQPVSPGEEDCGSFARMKYLLVRMAYSAREGYADFNSARNSLVDNSPLRMSRLTRRLMRSIRWDRVIERRRANYMVMAGIMDPVNDLKWSIAEKDVPLCYPFAAKGKNVNKIKKELAGLDVFTATYWPDVLPRARANTIEATLVNETLFLPIDQRLEKAQVEKVCNLVLELMGKYPVKN